jgi:hypothetical protein
MIYTRNKAQLKKELDAALKAGIKFFRLLESSGNQVLARNAISQTNQKVDAIIKYLSSNPDNLQSIYTIEGYTMHGNKIPQIVIEHIVKDAPIVPAAPTAKDKEAFTFDMSTANIAELAQLRVEKKHLDATISALEAKIEELIEIINDLEDNEQESVKQPDQIERLLTQLTTHTPTIMEIIKVFKPQSPAPILSDAPPKPANHQITRYTTEYWQWIDSIVTTNQPLFMQEYSRAKELFPENCNQFELIAAKYENESN